MRLASIFLVGVALVFAPIGPAPASAQALSLQDMMEMEGLGVAQIDPTGRWAVFERLRPYEEITDYSFRTYAMRWSGHRLWRYDLKGNGAPELLPGINPEPSTYIESFSEDGRYLSVFQYAAGDFLLGAYDMRRSRLVTFSETPAFTRTGEYKPVWASPSEIVFSALPEGDLPLATSFRVQASRLLNRAWENAWRGQTPTSQVFQSEARDAPIRMESGRLMIGNARTGRTTFLAPGLFADIQISPNRRHIAALGVSTPRMQDPDLRMWGNQRSYHLTIVDLTTHAAESLAVDLEFLPLTLVWSPDGREIAGFAWPTGSDFRKGAFHIVDVETGDTRSLPHIGLNLVSEEERGWFQRPERAIFMEEGLAVFARANGIDAHQDALFTAFDPGISELRRADWFLLSAADRPRNLTANLQNVSAIPVGADQHSFTIAADRGVYRVFSSGEALRLTRELEEQPKYVFPEGFGVPASLARPPYQEDALFVLGAGTHGAALLLRPARRAAAPLAIDVDLTRSTLLAGSSSANLVLVRSSRSFSTSFAVAESRAGATSELVAVNNHLNGRNLGEWRRTSYTVEGPEGRGHVELETCVLLPPDFDANHAPPLVIDVYPNVRSGCRTEPEPIEYPDAQSPYLWAARGFAYVRLPAPRELIRTSDGPIAGITGIIASGIEALASSGLADRDRVVLHGFSQGGVAALYTSATLPSVRAVIAKNSWANLLSHYFEGAGMHTYAYGDAIGPQNVRYETNVHGDFAFGSTPFDDAEAYLSNSPVLMAPQITSDVLLFHTDMDTFSMSQFDQMYAALRRVGANVRYVRYLGEGHAVSSPANMQDMWREIDQFLDVSLGRGDSTSNEVRGLAE